LEKKSLMNDQKIPLNPIDPSALSPAQTLRNRADEKFRILEDLEIESLGPEETKRLVHELRIHQIELELQNEELRQTQEELEASRVRFADLYDFAPVGYVTMDEKGLILEANLTIATRLGVTRNMLIKQPLTRYIMSEDQDIYYRQRKVLLETRERQTYELRLLRTDGPPFWAVLEATVVEESEQGPSLCRITLSEITELKRKEEALRTTQEALEKSHRRYADLYDFAPVAYLTMSDKGTILEANLTAADMLGMTRGHLLKQKFSTFIVPDDQDTFFLHRKKLLETGEKQSYELRLQKKDGPFFHALVETVMDQEDFGPLGQFRVTLSDISVRKEEELARLRLLKERYRAIVMDQNELICRFDPQGRLTFVNDAYCRCFGVNHWDILGTNYLPDIYKDDLPLVRDHFKNLTPLNPEKTIEHRVRLPDGKISCQQWSGRALYNEKGEVIEYQAVGRDITRRKEAEEKLQSEVKLRQMFMDALPCVALLLKYHTREIVASNKAAVAVGAVPGRKCYATWGQREDPCPWCLAPKLWEGGVALNDQFWGLGIYWDAYWIPVGEDLYLHYAFDITEEQKNKEALEKVHEELERRVRERTLELQKSHQQLLHAEKLSAVGSLSASIAHEFNNPLQSVMTIIKGISQYVPLEQKEVELVALALQECHRMKNLIANLRDFYRPSSGKPTLTDLHATLDALLLIGKKDLHTRDITVVKKYASTLPSIMAVPDQLKQVFLNLLTNAADACEGGGAITIATETIEGNVVVHIEDNGTGISPAHLPHIFEPFFTTKPELKGTGLGLSVSYGIIKKHGGHIDVKSEPGKGSLFSVFLPVMSANNEQ
jgi:PAS domain S-box-containing protein